MMASNVGGAFAESLSNQTSDNLTDSSSTQSLTGNITTGVSNTTVTGNTTNTESNSSISNGSSLNESSNELTVADSAKNSSNNAANDNSASTINDNTNNSGNSTNTTAAAGGDDEIHGVWVQSGDVFGLNVTQLLGMGITDVYVKCNIYSNPTYKAILSQVVSMFNGTGIRVNAWVTCFQDANGKWINPQGTSYNYTVKVPYEGWYQTWQQIWYQTWQKSWHKTWYKSHGKWRSYWRYSWQSTWKSYWKLNWVWGQTTFDETRTGYDTSHNDEVVSAISDMVRNYGVDGVNLDYCRYPGTAYKYNGGTEAITNFVKQVYDTVKGINPNATVSADVMPEGPVNAHYYGQNYTQLAQYTDYLIPMIYKGNYGKDTTWIGKVTSYIVNQTNGKPVIAGLQTYKSDNNTTPLPTNELEGDINESLNNGASGYTLFRYGLINGTNNSSNNDTTTSDNDTVNDNNTTVLQPTFTNDQILDASATVKSYIESNKALPAFVKIGSTYVTMAQFLQLMVTDLLNINSKKTGNIQLETVNAAPNPTQSVQAGNIYKSEYLDMAQRISSFIENNGAAPNYVRSHLGNIQFESAIYIYSRILNYYGANGRLPNYAVTSAWTGKSSKITQVYIASDNINNLQTDTNRINQIINGLAALGVSATNWGVGSNEHITVLQSSSVPQNALVVNLYGGACAGTLYEMGGKWYKSIKGARDVFTVFLPRATDITGLAWLPRAHDDNFSPASFTGLANPDQYLANNGYRYVYSDDIQTIINSIYRELMR